MTAQPPDNRGSSGRWASRRTLLRGPRLSPRQSRPPRSIRTASGLPPTRSTRPMPRPAMCRRRLTAAPPPPALPQYPGAFGNYSPPGYQQPGQPGYPISGYPQQPYRQPGPYGYLAPNPNARNGLAVTALVLGIVGLFFSWVPFFDALIIVPGVIFGLIGLSAARRRAGVGRAMAIVGLCLSLVAAVICVSLSVYFATRLNCTTVDSGSGRQTHCTVDGS